MTASVAGRRELWQKRAHPRKNAPRRYRTDRLYALINLRTRQLIDKDSLEFLHKLMGDGERAWTGE